MRVAYLASSVHPDDGWGRYSRELLAAAPGVGIEPVLVTVRRGGGDPVLPVERHDLLPPLLAGRCELPRSLLHAPSLRRVVRGCAVVHALVEPWLPLAALAAPRALPLVQTAHGSWAVHPLRRPIVRRLFARALARTDLLVCQSGVTRDAVLALASPPRAEVIPGGVDLEAFAAPAGPLPEGWPGAGRVVLSVGALKPRKGHHVALEAFALAARRAPDLRWVVVGAPLAAGYAGELRARAEALGVGEKVCWLSGLRDGELAACYRHCSVFLLLPVVHRGSFEGLGLVYLEAAAAGRPAIGTRGSGAVDAVVEGETGLLVPQEDPAAAAAALERLLGDPELARRLGSAGGARASRMTWAALAECLAERYRELVVQRAGPGSRPGRAGPP